MREVIVTVGPRASGKTSFCEKVIVVDPSIVYVNRDNILVELFGESSLDPYSGDHIYAYKRMWEVIKQQLNPEDARVILDTWNGDADDRRLIIKNLREHGADRIIAWLFVTPIKLVEEWFWKKPGIAKISEINKQGEGLVFYSEDAPRRDFRIFRQLVSDIGSDGFDEVIKVNPITMLPERLLCL